MDLAALLHSVYLLPALAGMIVLDAPFPMVPSEPALMSAYGLAVGAHAWLLVAGLIGTAFTGAFVGDLLMWRLGRTTRRIPAENALSRWVGENIERRTGAVIVAARFVPGGRLVSTLAAGRYGIPLRVFAPWAAMTSAVWAVYMLVMGLVLAPLIAGDPVRGLLAGIGMAVVMGGVAALVRRVRALVVARRAPVAECTASVEVTEPERELVAA